MVAYSFKARFIEPIRAGTKRQTIRNDRKRHARPGEDIQCYYAMRTKQCTFIARTMCEAVSPIRLDLSAGRVDIGGRDTITGAKALDRFAVRDGFGDWRDMTAFWEETHDALFTFAGKLIEWKAIAAP